MADCLNCPYEATISELKRDAERNSSQHREFYNRFAENEKAMAVSDERYTNLLTTMIEVKGAVNEIKDRPAKKWDSVSMYIVTSLVGLILGYIVNLILH